jgi:hypothetical protein
VTIYEWVELLSGIATIVIALALIAVTIAAVAAAVAARGLIRRLNGMVDKVEKQSDPIIAHAKVVAANVEQISATARAEVDQIKESLTTAHNGFSRATARAEERLGQLNALIEVVQDEAEQIFIGTASTMRGVKAGASALGDSSPDLADDGDHDDVEPALWPESARDNPRSGGV